MEELASVCPDVLLAEERATEVLFANEIYSMALPQT